MEVTATSRALCLDTGPRSFLHTTQPPLFVAGRRHADVDTAACAMIGDNVPQTLHEEVLLEIEPAKLTNGANFVDKN